MSDLTDSKTEDPKPSPCWTAHELEHDVALGAAGGLAVGLTTKNLLATVGLGLVGGGVGAADWTIENTYRELTGKCSADPKALPQVDINHSNK